MREIKYKSLALDITVCLFLRFVVQCFYRATTKRFFRLWSALQAAALWAEYRLPW